MPLDRDQILAKACATCVADEIASGTLSVLLEDAIRARGRMYAQWAAPFVEAFIAEVRVMDDERERHTRDRMRPAP